eukprot:3080798-Rhodomonas_salina.1
MTERANLAGISGVYPVEGYHSRALFGSYAMMAEKHGVNGRMAVSRAVVLFVANSCPKFQEGTSNESRVMLWNLHSGCASTAATKRQRKERVATIGSNWRTVRPVAGAGKGWKTNATETEGISSPILCGGGVAHWVRWDGQLVGWKARTSGVWGVHWILHWRGFGLHLAGYDWCWTVGKELGTMSRAPSLASMKALQNKIAVAKQQKKDMAEQEARRQADDAPGAAHGRGQFQRQKRLAQAAAAAAAQKALQKELVEAQLMREEEEQLVVAMELIDDIEHIVIEKEQMKAASHALTGHLQHTLCNYYLLKMMVALGAKIAG